MNDLELKEYLKTLGASLVGFADLSNINPTYRHDMRFGVAFAVKIKKEVVQGITNGPTKDYYDEYKRINKSLDYMTMQLVNYIQDKGYNAIGQTSTFVTSDCDLNTLLPHKTVATRAGLGWIGKNALLITPEYGSAVRLSSVLTDMPLSTDKPIDESKCGKCKRCVEACPAKALSGGMWNINSTRDQLIDPFKCRKKARELLRKNIGVEMSLCGKCIEVCPYTLNYIHEEDKK